MQLISNDVPIATGIYYIVCNITLKGYVGQARNIKNRIKQHLYSSISQDRKDYDVPFHAAIRKYGVENFTLTVLEICDESALNDREQYWIKELNTYIHAKDKSGYNVTEGGKHSVHRTKLTPNALTQIYQLLKENVLTYEEIAIKFNVCTGTIKKINAGKLCYTNTLNYPLRDNNSCKNKQKFGNYSYTGTAVEQLDINTNELLNLYPSALAASIALGNKEYNKHIAHCCAGKRKTAYGYKWRFREISETDWRTLFK
jgi:group I intron endonuclease